MIDWKNERITEKRDLIKWFIGLIEGLAIGRKSKVSATLSSLKLIFSVVILLWFEIEKIEVLSPEGEKPSILISPISNPTITINKPLPKSTKTLNAHWNKFQNTSEITN